MKVTSKKLEDALTSFIVEGIDDFGDREGVIVKSNTLHARPWGMEQIQASVYWTQSDFCCGIGYLGCFSSSQVRGGQNREAIHLSRIIAIRKAKKAMTSPEEGFAEVFAFLSPENADRHLWADALKRNGFTFLSRRKNPKTSNFVWTYILTNRRLSLK